MYPAVLLIYFISAAVILLASLALIVHVSLPYNKTGRASVLYAEIRWENMEWINLAQNTDEWQADTRQGTCGFYNIWGIF